jgi:hypothetical protein
MEMYVIIYSNFGRMNKIYCFFLLVSAMLLFAACDNEIELIAEQEALPVVFGLLNPKDSAQYIRVEKSFADPETSALILAQDPDQFFYQDASISLFNQSTNTTYPLEKVDGALEGYPRQNGDFANSPNYLYKINTSDISLSNKDVLRLEIKENESAAPKTAVATIIAPPDIRTPRFVNGQGFIEFTEGKQTEINWRTTNAGTYSVKLVLNIREENLDTQEKEDVALVWALDQFIPGDELRFDGIGFFLFLDGNLEEKIGFRRQFLNVDVIVEAYDAEVTRYIEVASANTGITGAQEIPTYTNINGGLGIFGASSRDKDDGFSLKNRTLDSLFDGRFTQHLNFTP